MLKFLIVSLLCLTLFGIVALALGGDPATFFTDNITATGTSADPTVMEQALLNRLNGATTSLDVAIYSLDRVSIRDALIAAHNRSVTVRVVADDDAYNEAGYNPHFVALQNAGIPLHLDNRSSLMHNKFLVIDGEVVWTGSTNMTDTCFTYNHNNSLVFTSTEMAQIYTAEFDEMFTDGLFGTAKTDNTTHTLAYAGSTIESYFSPTDDALVEVISEVNAADHDIVFATFYFTDDPLSNALIAEEQAGVSIKGIFDQLGASNQYSEDEALCAAGIPIKVENFGGKVHHKFMVVDANGTDPVVVTGSMNWTSSGGEDNDENTLIIHDAETAQVYLAEFQKMYDALGDETLCITPKHTVFLPLVVRAATSVEPTPTATPVTPTPEPTVAPTVTPVTPTPDPGNNALDVTEIIYVGRDEYVTIRNNGPGAQLMTGWTLVSVVGGQVYTFPDGYTLNNGATVRVHSGPDAVNSPPGDLKWSGAYYWANDGDKAELRDAEGGLRDSLCYGDGCP